MEQKIAEIMCDRCCMKVWCNFHYKDQRKLAIKECKDIKAIHALIEQEQKPMVEALKEAVELIPHDIDNFFMMECNPKSCHHCLMKAKIDVVLEAQQ